ncbi:unnamed protein product [Ixodes hexagonus]
MSFFDVRKWYSFLSLKESPGERKEYAPRYVHDDRYVDRATYDSRWDWDRSLRARPRPSRLRSASSERTLTEDSRPETPRSYLKRVGRSEGSTSGSLAGTDVLSTSWEAETPRSERNRRDPPVFPEADDDESSPGYETVTRVAAENRSRRGHSQPKVAEPAPRGRPEKQIEDQGQLEHPAQERDIAPEAKNVGQQLHDAEDAHPLSSKRWGKKTFGFGREKAVYAKVSKEKDSGRLASEHDQVAPAELGPDQGSSDVPLPSHVPPVPSKSWEGDQPVDSQGSGALPKDFKEAQHNVPTETQGSSLQPRQSEVPVQGLQQKKSAISTEAPYFTVESGTPSKVTERIKQPSSLNHPETIEHVSVETEHHAAVPSSGKSGDAPHASPNKSPSKKKGFFKLPSLRKRSKSSVLSAENTAVAIDPSTPEAEVQVVIPSFEEILAELRREHLQKQAEAEQEHEPAAPRRHLKKVPPPVPPKTWKDGGEGTPPTERVPKSDVPKSSVMIPVAKPWISEEKTPTLESVDTSPVVEPTMSSFFGREHEVTVLQRMPELTPATLDTSGSLSSQPFNSHRYTPDAAPQRRHHLRMGVETTEPDSRRKPIVESSYHGFSGGRDTVESGLYESIDLAAESAQVPIDDTGGSGLNAQSQILPQVLRKTSGDAGKKKLFKFRLKKRKQSEDNSLAMSSGLGGPCEGQLEDIERQGGTEVSSKSAQDTALEPLPADISAVEVLSNEPEEPKKVKDRRFNLKLSSMRKKKSDERMKKRGSVELPGCTDGPPSYKENMIDTYLRSLAMQPAPEARHDPSDDRLVS